MSSTIPRYRMLEKRRNLELNGFAQEVKLIRDQVCGISNAMMQLSSPRAVWLYDPLHHDISVLCYMCSHSAVCRRILSAEILQFAPTSVCEAFRGHLISATGAGQSAFSIEPLPRIWIWVTKNETVKQKDMYCQGCAILHRKLSFKLRCHAPVVVVQQQRLNVTCTCVGAHPFSVVCYLRYL